MGHFSSLRSFCPLVLNKAVHGEPLPIYGDGMQVRDWLYVGDHAAALRVALEKGVPGQTYNIGGWNEPGEPGYGEDALWIVG